MPPRKQFTKSINIKITEEQDQLICEFVIERNTTKSNLFRTAVLNQIEYEKRMFGDNTT